MKPIYKFALLLLLIPTISFTTNPVKKHERSKRIKKTYNVNSDAKLYISNKYGNVEVTTWDKNQVSIEVVVTVKGNNESKVEDKLESIDVDFSATKSLVEAKTIIGKRKSSWSWWGNNNNVNYKINYFVKMPITNKADFNNRYGNIYLDELEGSANISCDYGKIAIESLLNKNNTIELDYCSRSTIGYMNAGNVNIDYSKLTVEKSNLLKVNTDYSTFEAGTTKDIDFNSDYGSVTVGEAINITGNSDYAGMRIGTVKKNLTVNTDYGSLRVKNLAKGFENVDIDGSYASIKIGTPSSNNFNFKVNLGYASFRYSGDDIEFTKSIKKSTKKYYEGSWGKGSSSSYLNIKSSYGSVTLKPNN